MLKLSECNSAQRSLCARTKTNQADRAAVRGSARPLAEMLRVFVRDHTVLGKTSPQNSCRYSSSPLSVRVISRSVLTQTPHRYHSTSCWACFYSLWLQVNFLPASCNIFQLMSVAVPRDNRLHLTFLPLQHS